MQVFLRETAKVRLWCSFSAELTILLHFSFTSITSRLQTFAEPSTALGIFPRSLVQQHLSFSSLYCSDIFVHHNRSNHSPLMLQCSLVLLLPRVNVLTKYVQPPKLANVISLMLAVLSCFYIKMTEHNVIAVFYYH